MVHGPSRRVRVRRERDRGADLAAVGSDTNWAARCSVSTVVRVGGIRPEGDRVALGEGGGQLKQPFLILVEEERERLAQFPRLRPARFRVFRYPE